MRLLPFFPLLPADRARVIGEMGPFVRPFNIILLLRGRVRICHEGMIRFPCAFYMWFYF